MFCDLHHKRDKYLVIAVVGGISLLFRVACGSFEV